MNETRGIVTPAIKALNRIPGCWAMRANAGQIGRVRLAPEGTADIIGYLWGRFFAIECKAPGKKPSESQAAFLRDVVASGGIGIVATSADEAVERLLGCK